MDPATKTILIVEDEVPLLTAMSTKLQKEGFKVMLAHDGQEGLQSALQSHPDLIIADIVMPNMDGFTMIEKLRQDEWGKDAEIILLTNLNDTNDVAKALQVGVLDFLVKSNWKLADLVAKIYQKLQD